MKILTTLIGLLMFNISFGQNQEKYSEFVNEAYKLYGQKEYTESSEKYKEAFDQLEGKAYPNDRYNAACSDALAGNIESSFYHLFRLAENPKTKYKNYGHITTDSDLSILHSDDRWDKLIAIIKSNKDEAEKDLDKPLVAILDSIYIEDQMYRKQLGDIEKNHGRDSKEMKAQWILIHEKDSINLSKIEKILNERGWLGADIIGEQGSSTLFLVIQHSDIETQLKYLPEMREAVTLGNANARSLALLEDRVALGQGNRQIYGSQIGRNLETGEYYVSPLIDPENVDERRAEVGLGTLADYVSYWGMTWDVEKHKERTKKIEAEK